MQLNFLDLSEVHGLPVVVVWHIEKLKCVRDLFSDASNENFAAVVGKAFLVVDCGSSHCLAFEQGLDWVLADDLGAGR